MIKRWITALVRSGDMEMPVDTTADRNRADTDRTPHVSTTDVMAIVACWAGAAVVTYFSKDGVVAVIAIAAAYYLAKWIVLKQEN